MRRLLVRLSVTATIAAFAACSSSSGDGGGGSGSGTDGSAEGAPGDGASGSNDGSANTDGDTDGASLDAPGDNNVADGSTPFPFTLTSTAFANNGFIPALHTCTNGSNVSPPLAWANAPAGTQSYAVVMRDLYPALGNVNYHWVIYDIAAVNMSLPAGITPAALPPSPPGAKQTYWSFGNDYSYLGPCPQPVMTVHDYQFTVYSFSTQLLPIAQSTNPSAIDASIQANKTGSATLTGKYLL